jgi:hypothetical protein
LRIDPAQLLRSAWTALTGVPGAREAPARARWLRALPMLVPVAATVALTAWKLGFSDRQLAAERLDRVPLLQLEREADVLRIACSARALGDSRTRATTTRRSLVAGPGAVGSTIDSLASCLAAHGWKGNFVPADGGIQPAPGGRRVGLLEARATLLPAPGNREPWKTLLPVLDQLSEPGQPIDLTRLVIRADEQGRYSVETRLRMACLFEHEKETQ